MGSSIHARGESLYTCHALTVYLRGEAALRCGQQADADGVDAGALLGCEDRGGGHLDAARHGAGEGGAAAGEEGEADARGDAALAPAAQLLEPGEQVVAARRRGRHGAQQRPRLDAGGADRELAALTVIEEELLQVVRGGHAHHGARDRRELALPVRDWYLAGKLVVGIYLALPAAEEVSPRRCQPQRQQPHAHAAVVRAVATHQPEEALAVRRGPRQRRGRPVEHLRRRCRGCVEVVRRGADAWWGGHLVLYGDLDVDLDALPVVLGPQRAQRCEAGRVLRQLDLTEEGRPRLLRVGVGVGVRVGIRVEVEVGVRVRFGVRIRVSVSPHLAVGGRRQRCVQLRQRRLRPRRQHAPHTRRASPQRRQQRHERRVAQPQVVRPNAKRRPTDDYPPIGVLDLDLDLPPSCNLWKRPQRTPAPSVELDARQADERDAGTLGDVRHHAHAAPQLGLALLRTELGPCARRVPVRGAWRALGVVEALEAEAAPTQRPPHSVVVPRR
eukprot:scaffold26312_cov74-Phaeocystis_antarctica.AAC.2